MADDFPRPPFKPIAAVCHRPWMLINAKSLKGRRLVDRGLVTSRKPDDLPALYSEVIRQFGAG